MQFKELVFLAMFLLATLWAGMAYGESLTLTWTDNSDNELGFIHVASGPMVRSSYHAELQAKGDTIS